MTDSNAENAGDGDDSYDAKYPDAADAAAGDVEAATAVVAAVDASAT